MDRQTLADKFDKFFDLLQTEPPAPDYLGEAPEAIASFDPALFDPYQMVAEWIALRHEVKQQGKLLQSSQNTLQQSLEGLQAERIDQQQRLKQTQALAEAESKTLWRDLLAIVDALDQANAHWETQIAAQTLLVQKDVVPAQTPQPFWQVWLQKLIQPERPEWNQPSDRTTADSLLDILVSNQQGVALIRRSLLDLLRQRQVIPIEAQGQPFNPQIMYAVGRQESLSPENTVIQEVVRGYLWKDQVLREAQVIVAVKKA